MGGPFQMPSAKSLSTAAARMRERVLMKRRDLHKLAARILSTCSCSPRRCAPNVDEMFIPDLTSKVLCVYSLQESGVQVLFEATLLCTTFLLRSGDHRLVLRV